MLTLENDRLVFRFPQIEKDAKFSIEFQRTLRIPDTEKTYCLPPGLGRFPVRHAEDFTKRIPSSMTSRGGVILPIWQAEAMWLNFDNEGPNWELDFPVAIKVAAGKINAVTGEPWRSGLRRDPQDYMVSPGQLWLDGFAIEKGVIRQFVAMPLGDGYTPEEQLTGDAEWGGLQISVIPLKVAAWKKIRAKWEKDQQERRCGSFNDDTPAIVVRYSGMGLAAGGRMRQKICEDTFALQDWDIAAADRVFVSLVHAKDWITITGEPAPNKPPSAQDYSEAGLPWFEYFDRDQVALLGGKRFQSVKSVAKLFEEKTGASLPNSQDIEAMQLVKLVTSKNLQNQ